MAVMHKIDIRRIDLNLLIAFEAIYQEGSVTRASHRLFLSQSAMSHALARLRELCGDPLFERQGNAMVPTAMARQLVTPVQSALGLLERSLNRNADRDGRPSPEPLRIGLITLYEPAFLPRL
ncbi:MAG: LysR family transcriptional regulator, partial [Gammaproteobacteria bacterium]